MAQSSVRGACGFVLTVNPETAQNSNRIADKSESAYWTQTGPITRTIWRCDSAGL